MLDRLRRPLAATDAVLNRLYGHRANPLYHSGVVAVALLAAVLVSGVYLLLFYRIGAPYESVARITNHVWLGQWMRSFHRYASDAAIVASLVHLLRMVLQRRTWGARWLAWITGLVLLGSILVCGWTGYVMVWDVQAEALAREGARFLDALPLFAEPISRTFDGERPLPGAFFFLNLFAHVALPIALGLVLWLHVSRVARAELVPPKPLLWASMAAMGIASLVLPVQMEPAADVFRLPARAEYDVFYAFFLPLTTPIRSVGLIWAVGLLVGIAVLLVPVFMKPKPASRPLPSVVDQDVCTGCRQCYLDCPYEAIEMVTDPRGRDHLVALVDPDLCTACGICAGSCAPMVVGPPGRTGREQLRQVKAFMQSLERARGGVVLVACDRGAGGIAAGGEFEGAPVYPVACAGNVHTSVIEYLVRAGAGGVLVVSCPPRDCWNREGPKWTEERLFHGREAELQDRVDHRRVRLVHAGEAERGVVRAALALFRGDLARLEAAAAEADPVVGGECEPVPEEVTR